MREREGGDTITTTSMYEDAELVKPRIKTRRMEPVEERAVCKCGGAMCFTGNGITPGMAATRWRHVCAKCKAVEWYDDTYPRTVYRRARK